MEMDLDLDLDDDQFAELNVAFMVWLAGSSGVALSPKIGLQDLRSSSAGRGVGACSSFSSSFFFFFLLGGEGVLGVLGINVMCSRARAIGARRNGTCAPARQRLVGRELGAV